MTAPTIEHEATFVRSFIHRSVRERWLRFAQSSRRRDEFLDLLHGIGDAPDGRFVTAIPNDWGETKIVDRLRQLGASRDCFVFSSDAALDGRIMPLEDAVAEMLGQQMGSVASCIAGKLAYWEAEGPNDRVICHRL